jgi:AAA domain, putative AbiEii toxin, Type IV TA system/AAA ATPase domain
MYTSIRIENFRSIEHLNLDGLKRVNLFVGKNNSGKTSLLESVFLLGGATTPALTMTIGNLRGQRFNPSHPDPDPIWRAMFARFDPKTEIEIAGRRAGEEVDRRLTITAEVAGAEYLATEDIGVAHAADEPVVTAVVLHYEDAKGGGHIGSATIDPQTGRLIAQASPRDDQVRTIFVSARSLSTLARDTEQFGYLLKMKRDHEVLDALRLVEPGVRRIEVVPEAGASTIYADVGLPALVPLLVCGEGVVRLFSIAVELTAARGGALLVDEIDNGLHHSVMDQFWEKLGDLAREHDVQIFATTHNDELLRSALAAFGGEYTDLALYRLDREGGRVKAVRYSEEALQAVQEVGFEVRG